MKNNFKKFLLKKYPSLADLAGLDNIIKYLISEKHIDLPLQVFDRIQESINAIVEFSHSDSHLKHLKNVANVHELKILSAPAPQRGILSAFDYHYDTNTEQLSLIEVNTNASAFLLAEALYDFTEKKMPLTDPKQSLVSSIHAELYTFNFSKSAPIYIIDENLDKQKMYFEFLMYKDFFKSAGHETHICDFKEILDNTKASFIYNRYCDFLLDRQESSVLLNHFLTGKNILSPSPKEYLLMAAKDRLAEFNEHKVSATLIPSKDFTEFESPDELWSVRKKYYFKPRRMYGGKAVFRGSSISKKRFLELDQEQYLAQESRAPGIFNDWKFDLRVYVYGSEIQLIVSRIFKGQLLNFSNEGGGLTTVSFS